MGISPPVYPYRWGIPLPSPYPPSIYDILTGQKGGIIPNTKCILKILEKNFWKNFPHI